jgi:hypothetical protein
MSEHEFEAVRGVPGDLPEGETVLWQGAPDWWILAIQAFKIHWIGAYFILLMMWRFIEKLMHGSDPLKAFSDAYAVMPLALVAIAILSTLSWVNARSTVYTITTHRVIMRFGAALTKAINIPFRIIESASADVRSNGTGTVAVKLVQPNKIPLLLLWPHRRPKTFHHPEPAFRAIKDASTCAPILAQALAKAHEQVPTTVMDPNLIEAHVPLSAQPSLA